MDNWTIIQINLIAFYAMLIGSSDTNRVKQKTKEFTNGFIEEDWGTTIQMNEIYRIKLNQLILYYVATVLLYKKSSNKYLNQEYTTTKSLLLRFLCTSNIYSTCNPTTYHMTAIEILKWTFFDMEYTMHQRQKLQCNCELNSIHNR